MKNINKAATKVYGISLEYKNGKNVLKKEGAMLPAKDQETGLRNIVNHLVAAVEAGEKTVVLVAHNGLSFDFPVLLHALERQGLMDQFSKENFLFLDSLKLITEEMKNKHGLLSSCLSWFLGAVYLFLFNKTFIAHDATEDTKAPARVLYKTGLHLTGLKAHGIITNEEQISAVKSTFSNIALSDTIKSKLAEAVLENKDLKELYEKGGSRAIVAVLAMPTAFQDIHKKNSKRQGTKIKNVLEKVLSHFICQLVLMI